MLGTMIAHIDRSKTPLSKYKLQQAITTIVAETEDEEWDAKCNDNNLTTDTFIQPPVTTNTPREKTDVANERRVSSGSLTKGLKLLLIDASINNQQFCRWSFKPKYCRKRYKKRSIGRYSHWWQKEMLTEEIIHRYYWRTEKYQLSSKASSCRLTKWPWMGLRQVGDIGMRYMRFSIKRSSRAQRAALWMFSKILRW